MRSIFEGLPNSFISSEKCRDSKQFQFLPNTSYAPTGEVYAASWTETGVFYSKLYF